MTTPAVTARTAPAHAVPARAAAAPVDFLLVALPQALLVGTLLFAIITYGGVIPWAAFPIHWATLALLALTVLRALYRGDVRLPRGWINLPIAVLALSAAVSTIFSIYPYGSIRELLRILNYLVFFYLAAIHLGTERALVRFLTIIVFVAALLPFVGAYQDWIDVGRGRDITGILPQSFGIATYTNPNHFGAFLAMVLPAALVLAGYLALHRQWRWLGAILICLPLITISLMETLTRAAWMGVIFGLLAMTAVLALARAVPRERKAQVVVAVIAGLLLIVGLAPAKAADQLRTIIALGDTDASMALRYAMWNDSLRMIRDHPALGTGLGTFDLVFARYRSAVGELPTHYVDFLHNDYLQYAAEMGVFVGLALVSIFLLLLNQLGRRTATEADHADLPLTLGILGSIMAFGVAVFYSFDFYIMANGLLFWTLAGAGAGLSASTAGAQTERR